MTIKAQDAPGKPLYGERHIAVPLWLWGSSKLSRAAKDLLCLLEFHRNRETNRCNPRIGVLAAELGVSSPTVKRALRELRRAKLVKVTWEQRSSSYTIAPVAEWLKILRRQNDPSKTRLMDQNDPSEKNPDGSKRSFSLDQIDPSDPPHLLMNSTNEQRAADAAPLTKGSGFRQPEGRSKTAAAAATPPERTSSANERRAQALIHTLLGTHPQPGLPRRAVTVAMEILRTAEDPEKRVARIQAAHERWCEYWAASTTKIFIPQLWRWLSDGDFEHPPNDDAIATRKKPAQERRKSRIEEAIDNA